MRLDGAGNWFVDPDDPDDLFGGPKIEEEILELAFGEFGAVSWL